MPKKRGKDVKIKKDGDELDAFFARLEARLKGKQLQNQCKKCGKHLEAGWKCCPFYYIFILGLIV